VSHTGDGQWIAKSTGAHVMVTDVRSNARELQEDATSSEGLERQVMLTDGRFRFAAPGSRLTALRQFEPDDQVGCDVFRALAGPVTSIGGAASV
jgi:hypothetical protein